MVFEISKDAFDESIVKIDQLSTDSYQTVAIVLQILRDSVTHWSNNDLRYDFRL